ncbi:hypothetical protein ACHAWF_013864 [Thalassiosira exigua]
MGVSEHKYVGVPGNLAAPVVEDGVPIVPVATPVDPAALDDPSSLPTARKVNARGKGSDDLELEEERGDGITVTWEKGEVQPSAYRDKWFAAAFLAQLTGVVGAAIAIGPAAWEDAIAAASDESGSDESAAGDGSSAEGAPPKEFWFAVVGIALVVAPALSFLAMTVMNRNAAGLIKASLWFSIVLCGLSAAFLLPVAPPAGIMYAIFTVCLVWYARAVKNRIPYAASNLKCGITVLKANLGLGIVSLASMTGLLCYSGGWVCAFVGTIGLDFMTESTETVGQYGSGTGSQDSNLSAVGSFVVFLFVLSLYWTHQVLKNIVRTTVSGVVGTWWFSPAEAGSFCSTAVSGSLVRSTTYSLGSICFGSLIVAILHMVRDSLRRSQNDRNGGILRCIALCILTYIERLVEYFNKWAFIYVGLYGYGYIDAGKRVFNLFKTRGWTTIIADNLVNRLLGIMCLAIGLLTGVCTLFAAFCVEEWESTQGWIGMGFLVGFLVGLILSGVFMGLLSSAVDAIIVCFAEAPKELEESHPKIAHEMSSTWSEAWGDTFGPVIVGLGGGLGVV